jgi:hypothetical protein
MFNTDSKTVSSAAPSDSNVSEDAGIKPRTVATSALAVSRSNNWDRSHPLPDKISPTTWLVSSGTWLDLIHNLTRSHP